MIIRWEFQNGKMGLHSSKIDQNTAKMLKVKFWKITVFVKKNTIFKQKLQCYFSRFYDLHFLHLGQFLSYITPFYPFGILKVSSLKWSAVCLNVASNIVTMLEKSSSIFYYSVSMLLLTTILSISKCMCTRHTIT